MRPTLLILCVCLIIGVKKVTSVPMYKTPYRGWPNMLRSWRMPWYRDQIRNEGSPDWLETACERQNRYVKNGYLSMYTTNGRPCMKSHGSMRMLTWCKTTFSGSRYSQPDVPLPPNTTYLGILVTTIVETRSSFIPPCQIYDVSIRVNGDDCFLMLIDGLLFCVEEDDLDPQYQTLTLYPVYDGKRPDVSYKICSKTGLSYCPGPAKIPSLAYPEEEIDVVECPFQGGCG